ncbi:Protein of unknown function (DUF775) [Geosmithia morbida]|uniref:Hikeshi-like domain-containing protein n=1 Tax=Geosmithia morbida TaxID=1094350 RepID=A0A9P4YYC6_9HYPO|nr:Protein of unknown function (DUF775) [Geosmithia morbida]KAF4125348.1 Protein of unknown function (DUF775) [Geosmithia morbida]
MSFGLVPTGHPLITSPASAPSPTSFLYALPITKPFSHITVFLLPNVTLPPQTAAAIYLATAEGVASGNPNFRFLGGIGPGKESAMFKIGSGSGDNSGGGGLVIGIEVEPEAQVAQQLQQLAATKPLTGTPSSNPGGADTPPTGILAQRIIQNAFNFLASFSGTAGPGGIEVVPLKAFEDWWRKFESKVRNDPSFLEKQSD